MNRLNVILELYAGGPGSGCNPAVAKCGRPDEGKSANYAATKKALLEAFCHNATVSKWDGSTMSGDDCESNSVVSKAVETLASKGFDPRIAQNTMLQELDFVDHATADADGWLGRYSPDMGGMLQLDAQDADGMVLVHEFGHAVDYSLLRTRGMGSEAEARGTSVWPSSQMTNEAATLGRASLKEAHDEVQRVHHLQKQYPSELPPPHASTSIQGWGHIHTKAPSMYALSSPREFFAEAFRAYYESDGTRRHLQEGFPKTYELVDKFTKGKLFK